MGFAWVMDWSWSLAKRYLKSKQSKNGGGIKENEMKKKFIYQLCTHLIMSFGLHHSLMEERTKTLHYNYLLI